MVTTCQIYFTVLIIRYDVLCTSGCTFEITSASERMMLERSRMVKLLEEFGFWKQERFERNSNEARAGQDNFLVFRKPRGKKIIGMLYDCFWHVSIDAY